MTARSFHDTLRSIKSKQKRCRALIPFFFFFFPPPTIAGETTDLAREMKRIFNPFEGQRPLEMNNMAALS